MRKILTAMALVLVFTTQAVSRADTLDEKYTPTKREWVQVYLRNEMRSIANSWQDRVYFTINLYESKGRNT